MVFRSDFGRRCRHGTIVGIGGKCLDIGGVAPANWSPLIIATCSGSPGQQWAVH
jgi:hypothetical protein